MHKDLEEPQSRLFGMYHQINVFFVLSIFVLLFFYQQTNNIADCYQQQQQQQHFRNLHQQSQWKMNQ